MIHPIETTTRLRSEPSPADVEGVRRLVSDTGFFSDEEVEIAAELVEARLQQGAASGYEFLFADDHRGRLLGYSCFGHIAGTETSYDLYWIAVHPSQQGKGLGRELIAATEAAVAGAGGCQIYAETSGREQYRPTRGFYARAGYEQAALFPDFYRPGDAKVVFAKRLQHT